MRLNFYSSFLSVFVYLYFMKKISLLLIFYHFSCAFISAQQIEIGKITDYNFSLLDSTKNELFIYGELFLKKVDLGSLQIDSIPLVVPNGFKFSEYTPVANTSEHYFIHISGGLVYKNRNDSIVRIDNSFKHHMQSNSSIFSYDSTLYRFGGYGFWSARNFITYFDKDLMEWEIENPINSKEFPPEFFGGLAHVIDDEVYFFNGYYNNPSNRYEKIYNKNLWKYNISLKEWTNLGTVDYYFKDSPIWLELVGYPYANHPIVYGDKLFISLSSQIALIDFKNNLLTYHEKGKSANYLIGKLASFFLNDRFYYFTLNDTGKVHLAIATESEMLGPEKIQTKLYSNNQFLIQLFIGLFFLIVSIIAILIFRRLLKKRSKLKLLENGITYKNKSIQLDHESMEIIRLLQNSESINSNEILQLIEKPQYSRAHNERIKIQKIEDLNFKLKTLLGINEDLITSSKSEFDRRIRVYKLNKEFLFK